MILEVVWSPKICEQSWIPQTVQRFDVEESYITVPETSFDVLRNFRLLVFHAVVSGDQGGVS